MKTVQIILFTHILRRYLRTADAVGTPGGTPGTPGRGTSGAPPGRTSGTPSTVDVRMFQARDKLAVYDGDFTVDSDKEKLIHVMLGVCVSYSLIAGRAVCPAGAGSAVFACSE